jgi:hypothetical protein
MQEGKSRIRRAKPKHDGPIGEHDHGCRLLALLPNHIRVDISVATGSSSMAHGSLILIRFRDNLHL